jgi:hypothetical protein
VHNAGDDVRMIFFYAARQNISSKFNIILYSKKPASDYFFFYPSQPNYFLLKIQDQNIFLLTGESQWVFRYSTIVQTTIPKATKYKQGSLVGDILPDCRYNVHNAGDLEIFHRVTNIF